MSSPFIWGGSYAQSLLSQLNINGNYYILQGTADPTVTAQNAPQGSIYFRTGGSGGTAYLKQDNGSSTNWTLLSSGTSATAQALQVDPSGVISGFTAGENITANDAVAFDLSSGVYKVYRADVTVGARKSSFIGFATATTTTGNPCTIRYAGFLGGFSGLTVSGVYYLGNSAGAITTTPTDTSPLYVAQAMATDTIFIPMRQQLFAITLSFYSASGQPNGLAFANNLNSMDAYNFSSWSASTAPGVSKGYMHLGEAVLSSKLFLLDGASTGGTTVADFKSWDKSSWSTLSNRTTAQVSGGCSSAFGSLVASRGNTGVGYSSGTNTIDLWNGSAWTNGASTYSASGCQNSTWFAGGSLHLAGYLNTAGSGANGHWTWNGSSTAGSTNYPDSDVTTLGGSQNANGIAGGQSSTNSTKSYLWNGSWSASMALNYVVNNQIPSVFGGGCASGSNTNTLKVYTAGGNSTSTNATTSAQSNNGSSWAAETAAGTARSNNFGGSI